MQPVEVLSDRDREGRLLPRQFSTEGRWWQVESTGRRWQSSAGQHVLCLTPEGRVFELIFNPSSGTWGLGFDQANPAAGRQVGERGSRGDSDRSAV